MHNPETSAAAQVITTDFPNLELKNIEEMGVGWVNIVYLVNGQYIFRLPKDLDSLRQGKHRAHATKTETELLKKIQRKLPVAVPKPFHIAPDYSYFSYEYIGGEVMPYISELPNGTNRRDELLELWTETAAALDEALTIEEAGTIGLQARASTRNRAATAKDLVRSDYLKLDESMRRLLLNVSSGYKDYYDTAYRERATVLHGDLGFKNWLHDQTSDTYAVIDWSSACIGVPEQQIASAFMWDSPVVAAEAAEKYKDIACKNLDTQLVFWDGCINLLNDLSALRDVGVAATDPQIIEMADKLQDWIDKFHHQLKRTKLRKT